MKKIILCSIFIFTLINAQFSFAQYTHEDTLRGSNGPGRSWWDVTKYDLHVKFNLEDRSISGYNDIQFKVLNKGINMQIDLQSPLIVDSIFIERPDFEKFDSKFWDVPLSNKIGRASCRERVYSSV